MDNPGYHVFGAGFGDDDLRYIGWTAQVVDEGTCRAGLLPDWLAAAQPVAPPGERAAAPRDLAGLSVFEIESAPSADAAREAVAFWCQYFRSLGLDVVGGH